MFPKWCRHFYGMHLDTLLGVHGEFIVLTQNKSLISHYVPGLVNWLQENLVVKVW